MRCTRPLLSAAALAVCLWSSPLVHAAGFERGPAPTAAALEDTGPYAIASHKIPATEAKTQGYGGATVHFPTGSGETFGVVVVVPGFQAFQLVYDGLVKKMASHGFVVVNMDTLKRGDFPDARATQMTSAMKHVVSLAQSGQVPFARVADVSRRAVVGNSMGGGAVLTGAQADASFKAVVALQPWHTTKTFPGVASPTAVLACETDSIAPNRSHSDPFYQSLPISLPRALLEIRGAGHLCSTFLGTKAQLRTTQKVTVAWLKRFLDDDMRYDGMVQGQINTGEFSRFVVEGF